MTVPASEKVDLSKYIEMRDGRASIRGRRLPVAFIVSSRSANNASISDLAYQFTLTEEQVLAALLYYREHQDEIDAQDHADAEESEAMHRKYARIPGNERPIANHLGIYARPLPPSP
jgi:uncharacterized protein (DUF433 family)